MYYLNIISYFLRYIIMGIINLKKYQLMILFSFFLMGCELGVVEPSEVNLGTAYYPVETGQYREYHVFKVDYVLTERDTVEYDIIEVVKDTFSSGGEISYKLYRYYKYESETEWSLDSIWSVHKNNKKVTRVENNVRFLNMTFPADIEKEWNGNLYNTNSEDIYSISSLTSAKSINTNTYTDVLEVEKGDNSQNLVETNFRKACYAKDIGLIYELTHVLSYQPFQDDTVGIYQVQTLTAFGNDSL